MVERKLESGGIHINTCQSSSNWNICISDLHSVDHAGIETILSKLQTKYWVPGVRKVIKSVKKICIICRRLGKQTEG